MKRPTTPVVPRQEAAVAPLELSKQVEDPRAMGRDPFCVDAGDRELPEVKTGRGMVREPAQDRQQAPEVRVGGSCQPVEVLAERQVRSF